MAKPQEAVDFVNEVIAAESDNRNRGEINLRFSYGDQWPDYAIASRGLDRPRLVVNETDAYVRQVANNQRQQRPRGKAHPVDSKGDVKIAKVVTGLGRHIEVNSNADHAYDTAFDHALRVGWGYWRLRTDYIAPDSFDQDIYFDTIDNPFSVYFDSMSVEPDGSDAKKALIAKSYTKSAFEKMWPGATVASFTSSGTGDWDADWGTKDSVRVAEYYYQQRKKARLVKLSDGSVFWDDQLPDEEILRSLNLQIIGDRDSHKIQIKWQKQTAAEILEEADIPGIYIPVVPVYGTVYVLGGRRRKHGIVEMAQDPQRMINFWHTCVTESYALAPKAKWLLAEGQDEDHEQEWANANLSPTATLRYKPMDIEGKPVPPPQRIQPQAPEAGMIQAAMEASRNLQKVIGIFDPAMAATAPKSGKAVIAERMQAENSNFHYYDNLTRSIKHSWRIMLAWFPTVYDTQRVKNIIGEDGKPSMITINEKVKGQPNGTQQAIDKVLNCVCVGQYDVIMETGPGFDTKRQEGVEAMVNLMQSPVGQIVAPVGADILVRQIDAPMMDVLADRLAAANPLSKIDEDSDIPPHVQMQMLQMQDQLKKAQQVIQGMEMEKKYRMDVQQLKEEGDTKRKLMDVTGRAYDTDQVNLSRQHTAELRAMTDQNKVEIEAQTALMLKGVDTKHLRMEIEQRDREQAAKAAEDASTQNAQLQ